MLAEEQLGSRRKLRAYACGGSTTIAAVSPGQFGTDKRRVHGHLRKCFGYIHFLRRFWFRPCSPGVYGCVVSHACVELRAEQAGGMSPSRSGLVHLSTPEQVHLPANRLYSGRTDLVLLRIDPARLTSPVRWEPGVASDPDAMLFPHLYGELPVNAVINVTPYRPDGDGRFAPLRAETD